MAPQMDDEPRYGQRASESDSSTSPASTPWPQYGAVSTPENTGCHCSGSQPQPGVPPVHASSPQGWAAAYPAPAQKLPTRVGPTLLTVFGVLVAVIAAPIALVVGVVAGMDMSSFAEAMSPVSSGDTVRIDESGMYLVASQGGDIAGCVLSSPSTEVKMESAGSGAFVASGLDAGSYVLHCQTQPGTDMVGITGMSVEALVGAGVTGLLVATVVGLIGLAMLIGGIVWLVVVNRRRRRILESSGFVR